MALAVMRSGRSAVRRTGRFFRLGLGISHQTALPFGAMGDKLANAERELCLNEVRVRDRDVVAAVITKTEGQPAGKSAPLSGEFYVSSLWIYTNPGDAISLESMLEY